MKAFFASLKEEIKSKWKELLILVLVNIFELFCLSALLANLNLVGVIIVSLILLLPALALFILCLKDRRPDKQDIKVLIVFVILSVFFGVIKSWLYIISLVIAYLFYKDKKSMYKWLFIISTICLGLFVFLTLIRVLPEMSFVRHDDTWHDITHVRHTFGFNHPNHILKYVLATSVFGYMYMGDNKKCTLIFTSIMLVLTVLLAWLTNCRTGLLVLSGMYVIMNLPFLVNWFKPKRLLFAVIILSFVMIALKEVEPANKILSGRPAWFSFFFQNFPEYILFGKYYLFKLLGDFTIDSYVQYPLDNDFFMTIFDGGLIALLTICYFFYIAFEHNTDKKVAVAVIGMFMYALTEAFELAFTYPLYIMMFVELIDRYYKHREKKKLEKDNKKELEAPAQ